MTKSLFGTSGIRGDAKTLFTKEFCYLLGLTFVEFLKRRNILTSIAVGADPRESSPRIKSDLFLGLSEGGVELFDEGVTPIPSINWLIKNTPIKSAIMVTGSHIEPHLNGVKFFAHNEEISIEDQKEIEEIYNELKDKKITYTTKAEVNIANNAKDLYMDYLLRTVGKIRHMKIAVDCANGGQSVVIPDLLRSLGVEVLEVNCNVQEDFIARDTDTNDKAVIEELTKTVIDKGCDLGIAFDGDGDRVVFIDEEGKFIQGEYSCSLIAKEMNLNSVVTTISASQVVETLGVKVYRTKIGSPYIIEGMKKTSSKFGFEPNGGAIFGDSMYSRDGGLMAMKMLKLFGEKGGKFSEMFKSIPHFYMQRTKVDYMWEQKEEILTKAKEEFKGVKIETLDGLKIWLDETTWILFRSSANAPEFRVFAESPDLQKSKDLLEKGMDLVKSVIGKE